MGIVLDIHERICTPEDAVKQDKLPHGWIMRWVMTKQGRDVVLRTSEL
jgi:hypothetical protein